MLAATFDIGTTAVKAVVVNENGEAVFTGSSVIHTIETENFKEQDPDEWYEAFPPRRSVPSSFPGRCRM